MGIFIRLFRIEYGAFRPVSQPVVAEGIVQLQEGEQSAHGLLLAGGVRRFFHSNILFFSCF